MADTDDKTEQPTSKKLDDARKKGQVPRSKEAGTFFVLLAGVLSIWAFSSFLGKGMRQIMLNSFTLTREQIFSEDLRLIHYSELIVDWKLQGHQNVGELRHLNCCSVSYCNCFAFKM